MSIPVALVAGLHGPARAALVDQLLREHPSAVVVHHEFRDGRVTRTVRDSSGLVEREVVELAHPCVSCTVRGDLIPVLLRQDAPLLIVELWDTVEPRPVAEALHGVDGLRLTAVLTALDAEHAPLDICRDELLADLGRSASPNDERHLAEVLVRQIEYATALVLPELLPPPLPPTSPDDLELCRDVLSHLAPLTPVHLGAPEITGAALCVHDLAARVATATAQLPADMTTPASTTVVWRNATAALHPVRFFDAMDELAMMSVRSRGRFWLANRPTRMLGWDAVAGVVGIADSGPWLATLPSAAWDLVSPSRRIAAELDWSEPHGDRVNHLVFTGPDLDPDALRSALDACLITPSDSVTEDPFAPFLESA